MEWIKAIDEKPEKNQLVFVRRFADKIGGQGYWYDSLNKFVANGSKNNHKILNNEKPIP